LPPDSPSTQEATPAAAAFEYPLSTRNWPIASRLLPSAMSACTAELPPDEDCVLVLLPPEVASSAVDGDDVDDVEDADEPDVDECDPDECDPDDDHVDESDVDGAGVDGAGVAAASWRPLGMVTTWPT
jgi:hypothetical protein